MAMQKGTSSILRFKTEEIAHQRSTLSDPDIAIRRSGFDLTQKKKGDILWPHHTTVILKKH
jgi:hypothetical protein